MYGKLLSNFSRYLENPCPNLSDKLLQSLEPPFPTGRYANGFTIPQGAGNPPGYSYTRSKLGHSYRTSGLPNPEGLSALQQVALEALIFPPYLTRVEGWGVMSYPTPPLPIT